MKFAVVIGSWSDGIVAVVAPFASVDLAHEWAKGEKLLGRLNSYAVKPCKSVSVPVAVEILDGEEGT